MLSHAEINTSDSITFTWVAEKWSCN